MDHLWTTVGLITVCGMLRVLAAEEEVGSPLRVAQCRANCISNFGKTVTGFEACVVEADCFMCWEKCQLLESNFVVWGAVCSKTSICSSGCQIACQFHREGSPQRVPVLVTQGQQVIRREGGVASWPQPPPRSFQGPVVYVVMRQQGDQPWRQVLQTMDLSARVPRSGSVRVLVVGRDGLLTIYSPTPGVPALDMDATPSAASSTLSAAREVLRQVGSETLRALRLPAPGNRRINTQLFPEPSQNPLDMLQKDAVHGWNLRELSLIHQKVLVIAEIAWNPPVKMPAVYFVTWEVDGGGLRGNLFTDSTSVTLSLWPDTVYHIQVELVRHDWKHGSQSEQLVLDTHTDRSSEPLAGTAPSVAVLPPPHHPQYHPHNAVLAGVTASMLSFLLVLGLFAWRCWPQPKLVEDLPEPSHIYRVYPPAVRLDSNPRPSTEPIPSVCATTSS